MPSKSDFAFKRRKTQMNWSKLSNIDLGHVVQTVDIGALQTVIEEVTFSDIAPSDPILFQQPHVLLHAFRLSQLMLEYMLHHQTYLQKEVKAKNRKIKRLQDERTRAEDGENRKNRKINHLKKELKSTRHALELYERSGLGPRYQTEHVRHSHAGPSQDNTAVLKMKELLAEAEQQRKEEIERLTLTVKNLIESAKKDREREAESLRRFFDQQEEKYNYLKKLEDQEKADEEARRRALESAKNMPRQYPVYSEIPFVKARYDHPWPTIRNFTNDMKMLAETMRPKQYQQLMDCLAAEGLSTTELEKVVERYVDLYYKPSAEVSAGLRRLDDEDAINDAEIARLTALLEAKKQNDQLQKLQQQQAEEERKRKEREEKLYEQQKAREVEEEKLKYEKDQHQSDLEKTLPRYQDPIPVPIVRIPDPEPEPEFEPEPSPTPIADNKPEDDRTPENDPSWINRDNMDLEQEARDIARWTEKNSGDTNTETPAVVPTPIVVPEDITQSGSESDKDENTPPTQETKKDEVNVSPPDLSTGEEAKTRVFDVSIMSAELSANQVQFGKGHLFAEIDLLDQTKKPLLSSKQREERFRTPSLPLNQNTQPFVWDNAHFDISLLQQEDPSVWKSMRFVEVTLWMKMDANSENTYIGHKAYPINELAENLEWHEIGEELEHDAKQGAIPDTHLHVGLRLGWVRVPAVSLFSPEHEPMKPDSEYEQQDNLKDDKKKDEQKTEDAQEPPPRPPKPKSPIKRQSDKPGRIGRTATGVEAHDTLPVEDLEKAGLDVAEDKSKPLDKRVLRVVVTGLDNLKDGGISLSSNIFVTADIVNVEGTSVLSSSSRNALHSKQQDRSKKIRWPTQDAMFNLTQLLRRSAHLPDSVTDRYSIVLRVWDEGVFSKDMVGSVSHTLDEIMVWEDSLSKVSPPTSNPQKTVQGYWIDVSDQLPENGGTLLYKIFWGEDIPKEGDKKGEDNKNANQPVAAGDQKDSKDDTSLDLSYAPAPKIISALELWLQELQLPTSWKDPVVSVKLLDQNKVLMHQSPHLGLIEHHQNKEDQTGDEKKQESLANEKIRAEMEHLSECIFPNTSPESAKNVQRSSKTVQFVYHESLNDSPDVGEDSSHAVSFTPFFDAFQSSFGHNHNQVEWLHFQVMDVGTQNDKTGANDLEWYCNIGQVIKKSNLVDDTIKQRVRGRLKTKDGTKAGLMIVHLSAHREDDSTYASDEDISFNETPLVRYGEVLSGLHPDGPVVPTNDQSPELSTNSQEDQKESLGAAVASPTNTADRKDQPVAETAENQEVQQDNEDSQDSSVSEKLLDQVMEEANEEFQKAKEEREKERAENPTADDDDRTNPLFEDHAMCSLCETFETEIFCVECNKGYCGEHGCDCDADFHMKPSVSFHNRKPKAEIFEKYHL